jgi:hypothetical protein
MCIQGNAVEVRTPAHLNFIECGMMPFCVIAQQYSAASFVLLHFHACKE